LLNYFGVNAIKLCSSCWHTYCYLSRTTRLLKHILVTLQVILHLSMNWSRLLPFKKWVDTVVLLYFLQWHSTCYL